MEKKKKSPQKWIIISVICFVVLVITTCIIFQNFSQKDFKEDFQKGENGFDREEDLQPLDKTTQDEITSFFEGSPSSSEIEEYCSENQMYCMYYCTEINSESDYCGDIMPEGGEMGNRTPPGNMEGFEPPSN